MTEAKDKLSRVESSSDDSEDEASNKRKKIEVGEKPSEEMVEKMEEKLEAANVDQKRLFLIVFQRFIMILSEHLVRCDTDGQDFDTDWYRWTIGRLQQVFLLVWTRKSCAIQYFSLSFWTNCNKFCFNSIMNKYKSTAVHWKRFSSHPIWIHTFWTCSSNLLHYRLKQRNRISFRILRTQPNVLEINLIFDMFSPIFNMKFISLL